MRRIATALGLVCVMSGWVRAAAPPVSTPSPQTVRDAASRAIALLDRSVVVWHQQRTCFSCHHQALPIAVTTLARTKGVAFDEALARKNISAGLGGLKSLDRAVQGYQQIDPSMELGYELATAADAGVPAGLARAANAALVASWQLPDGSWSTFDQRPPQSFSPVTATAIAARGIRAYLPPERRQEAEARTLRARQWLLATTPRDTAERAYQLLGLLWTDAPADVRRKAAEDLLARQRSDGGWSQLGKLGSDAFSTGEVLVALHRAGGVALGDPRFQRGLGYLLAHQDPDGSWAVQTRMHEQDLVSPPHFETGFPHGPDQMISCMATSWAAMALLETLPASAASPLLVEAAEWTLPNEAAWMPVALFGTADALGALLDAGLAADSATSEGTTALMMAATDPAKVAVLLKHGADVNKAASSGFTPLIVAANHRGAADVVRMLVDHGALVEPSNPKPAHDASPLFYAAWSGNEPAVALLLARGARADVKMQVGGFIPLTALEMAVAQGNDDVVRTLVAHGANVNQTDDIGISMLDAAVLINHVSSARTLIALGARVNVVDEKSFTALMHAASVDFGDTGMVELLLASGADPTLKSKDGLTALELARKYGHTDIADLLVHARAAN